MGWSLTLTILPYMHTYIYNGDAQDYIAMSTSSMYVRTHKGRTRNQSD